MKKVKKKRWEKRRKDALFKVTDLLRGKLDLKKIITQIHCFETNLNLLASTSEHRPEMLDPEKVNIMKEWTKEKPVYPTKPRMKKRKPPLNTQIVEEENPIHYPNFIPTNKAFE